MSSPIDQFLRSGGVVVLDGALATELERRGADIADPLWSAKVLIEAPERIEEVHYDYFCAGADVATSASYQATFEGFAARGLDESESERLLRLSVELARRARDRFWSERANRKGRKRPLVAASIGCYGAYLHDGSEYGGEYGLSRRELIDFHRRRFEVLADCGADLLACETIPSPVEAQALVHLLEERGDAPAWMCFSSREHFADCVAIASRAGSVVAAGANCVPPGEVSGLLLSARDVTKKPFAVYPNSGEVWDAASQSWDGKGASGSIAAMAPEWCRLGARLIGGCCRTTPETIRAVRSTLYRSTL